MLTGKSQLKPQLEILNTRVLEGRLFLASEAYLTASTGPIAALKHLYSKLNVAMKLIQS